MSLQDVQVTMDERREGLTKSHLPDATVPGIPAKERKIGGVSTALNSTSDPYFAGGSH